MMAVRSEVNMKVGNRKWDIDFNEETKLFELTLDNEPVLTPKSNPVAHENERLIFHIMAELRCSRTLDSTLNTLWLFSSAVDHKAELMTAFRGQELRGLLLKDPVLARSADPGCAMAQMTDWFALEVYLSKNGLVYPDFPQSGDPEKHLQECGNEAFADFDMLVDSFQDDLMDVSMAQRSVIANATNCYQSFTFAFFLATKQITPLEFAAGISAAHCALPWAFGDVKHSEYKKGLQAVSLDALMMRTFVDLF